MRQESKIEEVYLITRGGKLIAREGPSPPRTDPDVLAGMMWAVGLFVQNSLSDGRAELAQLSFGGRNIFFEQGRLVVLIAVVASEVDSAVRAPLAECVKNIEENHREDIENWKGTETLGLSVGIRLRGLIEQGSSSADSSVAPRHTPPRASASTPAGMISRVKVKVAMVGETAVGKTSLIRHFVHSGFDDRYITTLGAKVSKKEITASSSDGSRELIIDMTIWDILGVKGFRELLKEAFFHGTDAVLAVCDVTRKKTLDDLDGWIEGVYTTVGKVPIVFVANKIHLVDQIQITGADMSRAAEAYKAPFFFASDKTGENVEAALATVADLGAEHRLGLSRNHIG